MSLYRIKSKKHILEVPLYNYVLNDYGGWPTTLSIERVLSSDKLVGRIETYKSSKVFGGKDFLLFISRLKDLRDILMSCKNKENFYLKELLAVRARMKEILKDAGTATVALSYVAPRIKAFQRYKRLTMNIEEFWGNLDV